MKPHNLDIINLRDTTPHHWDAIADMINAKYGTGYSGNAVRKRYARLKGKTEIPIAFPPGQAAGKFANAIIDFSSAFRTIPPGAKINSCEINYGDCTTELDADLVNDFFRKVTAVSGNVLVIADIHLPFTHKLYLDFCRRTRDKYQCENVVFIGDVFEHHALGFWPHDPSGHSAGDELSRAIEAARPWYDAFPVAKICIGNHDERYFRQAFKAGIPTDYLKSYNEVFMCPSGWQWAYSHQIGDVLYTHGTGYSGQNAAIKVAMESMSSAVIGHTHSWGGVQWVGTPGKAIFGLNVGCGVEGGSYPMQYAAYMRRVPVLGCGVVVDGGNNAYFERMI